MPILMLAYSLGTVGGCLIAIFLLPPSVYSVTASSFFIAFLGYKAPHLFGLEPSPLCCMTRPPTKPQGSEEREPMVNFGDIYDSPVASSPTTGIIRRDVASHNLNVQDG